MSTNNLNLDSRFEFAIKSATAHFEKNRGITTVFDIGSGVELMKKPIEKLGMSYHSFDLFPPNENVRKWDIQEPFPYEGKADIVIMLEVIEHLNNPWKCLTNVFNVLNPGGILILSTPNPGWSESRLHLLTKGYLNMFTPNDLEVNHHVFTAWPHIVNFLLKDVGFETVQQHELGCRTKITATPFWGVKMPFRFGFRMIKKMIEAKDASAIGALYGMTALKK